MYVTGKFSVKNKGEECKNQKFLSLVAEAYNT